MFRRAVSATCLAVTAATLLVAPASATAAPGFAARIGAEGAGVTDGAFVARVGDRITIIASAVNTDQAPATGTLRIAVPTGLRVESISGDRGTTCAQDPAGIICTTAALGAIETTRVLVTGTLARTATTVLAATAATPGDTSPSDDVATVGLRVFAQSGARGCTILGTPGADRIVGTPEADVICGGAGGDTITSGAGDDTVHGDAGNDRIAGGAGRDRLLGGAGHDTLRGGAELDSISGDAGNDRLSGDAGDGVLQGGPGNDTLLGGPGLGAHLGGSGNDLIRTCDGLSETVVGGPGRDRGSVDTNDFVSTLETRTPC